MPTNSSRPSVRRQISPSTSSSSTRSSGTRSSRRRLLAAMLLALPPALVAVLPGVAGACGGLVGQNGTIELVRTTTLAAYHDGVERYVTSFEFSGEGEQLGSIVPLPDVPTSVERGGDWTLQRLAREVAPPPPAELASGAASLDQAASATVLFETTVDALDITILEGGGDEVGRWATENGFLLSPDAPEVLDFYAERSPIFMAARFDAARARELGQRTGDGTPIMLTIPTDDPWVPLRILGLGLDASRVVEADVFLLTDDRPQLLAGGPGLQLGTSRAASPSLLADLRGDEGMGWVPADMWLTHLPLRAEAGQLDYDLAVSTRRGELPAVADAGVLAAEAEPVPPAPSGTPRWPLALGAAAGAGVLGLAWASSRRAGEPSAAGPRGPATGPDHAPVA